VQQTVIDHLTLEATIGGYEAAAEANGRIEAAYQSIATMLNASPNEIAHVENATRGWDMAVYAIPFRRGDRVLTTTWEYASNLVAILQIQKRFGITIEVVPNDASGQIDLDALEQMLQASTAKTKLVVTDSVFSMDGDLAPLPRLLALCEQYGAWLVVDDAHGFGVLGENGRGALEYFKLRSPYLVYMGTLGKAAGVGGAFVAAHETVIEWLVQRARPYIYTTAAAPALAHALLASIDLIAGDEGAARRAHLQALISQLREGLRLQRWHLFSSDTAIQPVIIGPNDAALRAAAALYEQGFWVPAIRPPTVPADTARLRITLSAAHAAQDVEQLIGAINALERR